jgi:lipopolysaccharide export system protein LptA
MRRLFFALLVLALLASSAFTTLTRASAFSPTASPAPTRAGAQVPSPSATTAPTPDASPSPCDATPPRYRLCRPGSDIEADSVSGSLKNNAYVFKGNVILHSDPKVDKSAAETQSDDPITITADEIDVERETQRYVAKGKVHFTQGVRDGNADTAILDEKTHDVDLVGHARIFDGEHESKADQIHYNTKDKQFHGMKHVHIVVPIPTASPGPSPTPGGKKRRIPKLPV